MGFGTLGFSRTLLTNLMSKFKIKMADANTANKLQKMTWFQWNSVLGEAVEVADYLSKLEIQKGESCLIHEMQKWLDLDEILYLWVSGIADYAYALEIWNSKWRLYRGWPKYNKQLDLSEFQGFRRRWFQIRPQIQQLKIIDPILFSWSRTRILVSDSQSATSTRFIPKCP